MTTKKERQWADYNAVKCVRCSRVLRLADADAGHAYCEDCRLADTPRAILDNHIANTYEPTLENLAEAVRFLLEKQS